MDVIVLDTSPLLDDRPLKKPTTRGLLDACERGEIRIVVPSVVIDEVVNAAHGSFVNARKRVRAANHILEQQLPTPALIHKPDVDALTAEFRSTFEGALRSSGVDITSVTTASIQDLIDRDLAGLKPFNASGRGFRDALIWNVLKEVADELEDDRVVFVTRNPSDFADTKDPTRLHEDLVEGLSHPENVELLSDFPAVYKHLGIRRDDLQDVLARAVESEPRTIAFQTTDYVDLPLPPGLEGGEIVGAVILEFEVGDVFYAWGAASGSLVAEVEYIFTGILNDWEFDELGPWALDVQVDERNEDSHFVALSGESRVRVELTVALDPISEKLDVLNAELRDEGERNEEEEA